MFKDLTIKARLIFMIAILSLMAVLLGGSGIFGLASVNGSLKTVYEDRLIAMGQLDQVIRIVNHNQLILAKSLSMDTNQVGQEMDTIGKNIEHASKVWAEYMATYLTSDEKKIAQEFEAARKNFVNEGLKPAMAAMRANDSKLAADILHAKMTPLYQKVQDPLNALIALQLDEAKKEYEQSQSFFTKFRIFSMSAV